MELLKATHTGKIDLGTGACVPCYVLDDAKHTRVLSRRGFEGALDLSTGKPILTAVRFADEKLNGRTPLANIVANPIRFHSRNGVCHGFDTNAVTTFCEAFVNARRDGVLPPQYVTLEERCWLLVKAYMHIGLVALVDEATGYQEEREKDELQKLLKLYISDELMPWTARFPRQFFRQMFRLRGWSWETGQQGPRYAGKLVNWVVYDRMPPCVLDELRKRNPTKDGHREHHHHQHLTESHGVRELEHRITQAMTLMEVAKDWSMFARLLDKVSPPFGGQLLLSIPEEINA